MTSAQPTATLLPKYASAVDHIAIAVKDLEASVRLYETSLGFTVVQRRVTEGKASAMISAVMKAGPLTLVLMQGTSPDSQICKYIEHYGPGVQHVAFAVDDLQSMVDELKAAGLPFDTNVISGGGLRQIFTKRDPGTGMMFEFIERLGGDFSDQSVQELFKQLESQGSY